MAVSRKDRYVFRKFLTGSGRLQEVRMITQDNKKRLWVGTNKGLCVFMEIPLLLMLIIINFIIMKMEICPDMKLNVFS